MLIAGAARAAPASDVISRRAAPSRSRHHPSGRRADHVHRVDDEPAARHARAATSDRAPAARGGRRDLAEMSASISSTSAPSTSIVRAGARRARAAARASAASRVAGRRVPRRVVHLRPLVGAHHHDVVARGDVGDQLRVGDDDAELGRVRGEPLRARPPRSLDVGRGPPCRARRARARSRADRARPARTAASAIATCAIVGGSNEPG